MIALLAIPLLKLKVRTNKSIYLFVKWWANLFSIRCHFKTPALFFSFFLAVLWFHLSRYLFGASTVKSFHVLTFLFIRHILLYRSHYTLILSTIDSFDSLSPLIDWLTSGFRTKEDAHSITTHSLKYVFNLLPIFLNFGYTFDTFVLRSIELFS